MRNSRRIRRMGRNKRKVTGLNLTSLMDVFTILVFFLLFHASSSEVMEAPKQIKLPDSVVETKPRETVVIMVSPEVVLVQGEAVVSTKAIVESKEVTILADKTIPFRALKKIMSTCTGSGYGRISLAVLQKPVES